MSARNILVFVFFGCLAAIAFLIPESVKVLRGDGSSLFDRGGGKVKQEVVQSSAADPSESGGSGRSPLDKVLNKIESGAYDSKQRFASVPKKIKPSFIDKLLGRTEKVEIGGSKDELDQSARDAEVLNKVFQESRNLDWAQVLSPDLQPIYKRAIKRIGNVQRLLTKEYPQSRAKIQSYMDTVQKFGDGSYQRFPLGDTLRFLATSDIDVSKAFAAERVRRDVFQAWQRVGLDPLLKGTDAVEFKQKVIPPFKASVQIQAVKAQDQIRRAPGVAPYRLKTDLSVRATVIGADASKYQIYRGKELIKEGALRRQAKEDQPRDISFRQTGKGADNVLVGTYTIVLSDGLGNVHTKRYQFYPQLRRFKQSESGIYAVPPLVKLSSDSMLDRLFHVGATSSFFSNLSDKSSGSGVDSGGFDDLSDGGGSAGF